MSRSTDLAIWHGIDSPCQQRLTGKADLWPIGGISVSASDDGGFHPNAL